jgi:hypothetical protein
MGGVGSGTIDCEYITLAGDKTKDGKITKSEFFKFLNTDLSDYSHVKLTPAQAVKFKTQVIRMVHGTSAAIPMVCIGPLCPNKICPFHEEKNWPLTLQCLIESQMVQYLTQGYMEELGVEPEHLTEMTLVSKMVECDMIDYRANIGLSGGKDPEAASLLSVTVIDNGKTMCESISIHPLLEAKEKASRTKMMILESFTATRKERYKKAAALKKTEGTDASTFLSDLKTMFSKPVPSKNATSLDKIREDAEKVSKDLIFEADWSENVLEQKDK